MRTWAEVDLSALRHNVRTLRRRAADTPLMAVVKADAYGHGAPRIARAAVEAGADSLAVVTVEEGEELRRAGVDAPVLVFTDLPPEELRRARALGFTVTAHSTQSARLIASVGGLKAHLKVNTGMNRWGVEPEEVGEAVRLLGDSMTGVYTHFACADDPDGPGRRETEAQIRTFERVLAARSFAGTLVHAANSAGTLWWPAARYGCVRPGVALYGLHPAGGDPEGEGLRPVMALKSYVASVRRLAPGEGVSYGFTYRAARETAAATVPVGYAEGYRRALSGRSEALIGGRRRPLLGRITMDASVFECDADTQVGDEVVLLGEQGPERVTAEELGRLAGTINYEVTTGVNPRRVERRYV
ncbi:alr: alanine racemase [Rubrobacter radiotolerans]|uniref:Alanine racemase n=1 Tax=Rubrobacter radiotolerans TaxID=42256 RepID=A0A023X1M8_RUBRA|nr:alanine racemase [Rubrobacter radiotolerans]AHY45964.1 alr: alanine racemase [Rubrobacter radiotolerans]MDX5893377.1 alanine racemase [Rubrobacter radiotolerans]SMC03604.1 alanine racemase [Rubrobacter radiotolerans DSM 5868]